MNVEVLAVGTELLLGQIVNTNATEIARRLADRGFVHRHQAVVGDNAERMDAAIRAAKERSDAVIITGGIGPTQDDITREVVAEVAGEALRFDETYASRMRERWEALGRTFPESNLRQAFSPEGSVVIPNHKGSAPGFRIEVDGCWIVALPGVPAEMLTMLDEEVMPFLQTASGGEAGVVVSRVIRSWGMAEATVAELLGDVFEASTNPTVAFLASSGEIKVRLTAHARSESEAYDLIRPVEAEVASRLGDHIFGFDGDTIEVVLHRLLRDRGWRIATAESATGGQIGVRLSSVPGASDVYAGSVTAYAPDIKVALLGVSDELIADAGVVSEDVAIAMAAGAASTMTAEVAIGVTGSAGPDPLEADVGTMCIAVVTPAGRSVRTLRLPGDRERVRAYATTAALHLARRAIVDA